MDVVEMMLKIRRVEGGNLSFGELSGREVNDLEGDV
jgi:hypothetical protein